MARIISEVIREVKFKAFENFDCSKIVAFTSEAEDWNQGPKLTDVLKRIVSKLFLNRYQYIVKESRGKRNILFAYNEPHPETRNDVYQMMLRIFSCAENATFIQYDSRVRLCGFLETTKRIRLLVCWLQQSLNAGLSVRQGILVANDLLEALLKCELIKPFLEYKSLVVRYDAYFDNPVSQLFKLNGKITITAQHGVMAATDATNDMPYGGIWFRGFVSDYFMAWDEMTKREAMKDGIKESEIVICGNAKCIDSEHGEGKNNHVMGVLLDGIDSINRGMISIANSYCSKYGYKYILRYHPNYKGDEYDSIIDKEYYLPTERKSLFDFAQSVEFTVLGISTALLELLYMHFPVYSYYSGLSREIYKNYIPVYRNLTELEMLIKDDKYMQQACKMLVTVKDAREGYASFFKLIDDKVG